MTVIQRSCSASSITSVGSPVVTCKGYPSPVSKNSLPFSPSRGRLFASGFLQCFQYGRLTCSDRASTSSQNTLGTWIIQRGYSVRVESSSNGATNSASSSMTERRFPETGEVDKIIEMAEFYIKEEQLPPTAAPSCSLPHFSTSAVNITLLNPLGSLPDSNGNASEVRGALLLYVPGMDGTGQGIRSQLPYLSEAGYDIRCVFIPSSDRSSWQQLVNSILPLVTQEVQRASGKNRHLTVLGESFGGGLAMRLAVAAPSLVKRLVLVNPATNFPHSNPLGSLAAQSGLLSFFPALVYEIAQDILLPFMVKRNRVSTGGTEDFLSPVDFVPAACASWRLSMLNDSTGLGDEDLSLLTMPTLLIVSGKDRILPSMAEGARLQTLIPNAKRVVLPESGHTALLEDSINIEDIMHANGFSSPASLSNVGPPSPRVKRGEAVSDEILDEMGVILEPWRILTSPLISGEENLPMPVSEPRRPVLFVGNHTMFGIYDSPILFYELYLRGFRCRGLAHPGHWITGANAIFERYGNVKATKTAAYKLLQEGETILLFPGGAREVCKRKGEEYKLMWRETADFVRMASRHKAIIVPFGALGGDEAYEILYDADDIKASPLGPFIEQIYRRVGVDLDNVYPITAFPGIKLPSLVPIPTHIERIYFHFAEPLDTAHHAIDIHDREQAQSLYEMVRGRVESSIELLRDIRARDPERELPVRLLAKFRRLLPEFLPRLPSRSKLERLGKKLQESITN